MQERRGGSGSGVDVSVANTGTTCTAHAVLTEIQQLNRSREGAEFSAGTTRRLGQRRRRAGGQHWSDLHSTRSAYRNPTAESLARGSGVQCRQDAAARVAEVANTGPTCIAHAVLTEMQQLNRSREGVEFSAGTTRRLRQRRRRAGGQHWYDLHSTLSAFKKSNN